MNICCIYLTNTDKTDFNYKRILNDAKTSVNHKIDVYKYVKCFDNNDLCYNIKNEKNIEFSFKYLQEKFKYNISYNNKESNAGKISGLEFLTVLDIYLKYTNKYDFYIYFEDDISFLTDKNIFDNFIYKEAFFYKLITEDLFTINNELINYPFGWPWLHELKNLKNIYKQNYRHTLLCLYGLRTHIIENFLNYILEGNYGYHELLIPSFVYQFVDNKSDIVLLTDMFKCNITWLYDEKLMYNNICDIMHPVKKYSLYKSLKEKYNN